MDFYIHGVYKQFGVSVSQTKQKERFNKYKLFISSLWLDLLAVRYNLDRENGESTQNNENDVIIKTLESDLLNYVDSKKVVDLMNVLFDSSLTEIEQAN